MNLERRSHQFFTDFAKQISDANGRKIFMDFAKDEESHLQALVSEYNTLMRSSDDSKFQIVQYETYCSHSR